ncbi:MAG: tetratricopeptide repeat protein [Magnetococcales bacterium]|nr:tetratricopeptide repeat protein [Magnetococcales bacterium]
MSRVEVEGIFEEIDEQLEAENVARAWLKYQKFLIGGLILLFVGLFAYVGWTSYQKNRDQEISGRYFTALEGLESGDGAAGRKGLLDIIANDSEHGFAQLARFAVARDLVKEGKNDAAALVLEEVASMVKPPMKNLAIINASFVIADDDKRALRRLGNIPTESVFKAHALELAGVLTAKQGDTKGALALYKEAMSLKPDGGLRKRLQQRIQRMEG